MGQTLMDGIPILLLDGCPIVLGRQSDQLSWIISG